MKSSTPLPSPFPRGPHGSLPLSPRDPTPERIAALAEHKRNYMESIPVPRTVYDLGLEPSHPPGRPDLPAEEGFNMKNPGHIRAFALIREKLYGIPNAPTHTRPLKAGPEANFVRTAHALIALDAKAHPERPFGGEYGVLGDAQGNVWKMMYEAGSAVPFSWDDLEISSFNLHTHFPFLEPFTSTCSRADNALSATAAILNRDRGGHKTYVSNGKDVSLINAHDMGLVKLTSENASRPIPVGFELPAPPSRRHSTGFGT